VIFISILFHSPRGALAKRVPLILPYSSLCYYFPMLNGLPILNVFPDLLVLQRLAPFILRVVIGIIIINLGYLKFKSERPRWKLFFEGFGATKNANLFTSMFGTIEIIGGIALVIGLYTQLAALVFSLLTFVEVYTEYKESALVKRNIVFYILLLAIAVSLLFTGAGAFALDLPL